MSNEDKTEEFERDNKLAFIIFICGNLFFFLMILVINRFFIFELLFWEKIILSFGFSFLSFLFLKVRVLIKNNVLFFKNILGFTIKRINLKDVKGKKLIYSTMPTKSFLFLFGSKYKKLIQVKLDLKNSRKYTINGQFFSIVGLEKFLKRIN